jgi:hypothetical protein
LYGPIDYLTVFGRGNPRPYLHCHGKILKNSVKKYFVTFDRLMANFIPFRIARFFQTGDNLHEFPAA